MKDASESAERLNRISEYHDAVATDDVEIGLGYEESHFVEYLLDNNAHADTTIDIVVDGISLADGGFLDHVAVNCRRMLEHLEDIFRGDEVLLRYREAIADLMFYPEDGDTVRIVYDDYDVQGVPDDGLPVSKEAFAEELIATSEELYEFVGDINPALLEYRQLIELAKAIKDARKLLKAYRAEDE